MGEGPHISPAKAQDFLDFAGALPPYRVLAWTARFEGKVIGIGGILFVPDGGRLAFVDMSDEARRFKKTLHKTGLLFMREMRELGIGTIIATTETKVPRADEWLLRLGFQRREIGGFKVFIHD